jgi:hypothetical protein
MQGHHPPLQPTPSGPSLFCQRVLMHFSPSPRLPHRLTHDILLLAVHFGPLLIYGKRARARAREGERENVWMIYVCINVSMCVSVRRLDIQCLLYFQQFSNHLPIHSLRSDNSHMTYLYTLAEAGRQADTLTKNTHR